MTTKWILPTKSPATEALIQAGYDPLVASIMAGRGFDDSRQVRSFTTPSFEQIHEPWSLPDIQAAADLIRKAIAEGWPVQLITDYDVDGQTSGAFFYLYLRERYKEAGHDPDLIGVLTPNRFSEGYGLNWGHIMGAAIDGKKLVITFDCGIRSHMEGDMAKQLGLHLIITDHHEPPKDGTIPHADAVINPKRHDSKYPFKEICGCVVAWKLAWAVDGSPVRLIPFMDFAATATVSDMMPMLDENRALLHYGLQVLNGVPFVYRYAGRPVPHYGGRRPAFEALLEGKRILETDIGFKIGPPINALGRMGDANRGIRIMTELDPDKLKEYMLEITAENELRKQIQQQVVDEICATIDPAAPPPAIVYSSNFAHMGDNAQKVEGVVGIAAGKVGETFNAPAIVLVEHGKIAKGSGRAIMNLNLHDTLHQIDHLLIKWGGHEAAAGLSLAPEHVPLLREHMTRAVEALTPDMLIKEIKVDAIISGSDLKRALVKSQHVLVGEYPIIKMQDTMRPFGQQFPTPKFLIRGAQVQKVMAMGKTGVRHLKLMLESDGVLFEAVAWREYDRYVDAGSPQVIDLVGEIGLNEWAGQVKLQVTMNDWREAENPRP